MAKTPPSTCSTKRLGQCRSHEDEHSHYVHCKHARTLSLGGGMKVSEVSIIPLCIDCHPWSCWAGLCTWNVTFICQSAPTHATLPFRLCSLEMNTQPCDCLWQLACASTTANKFHVHYPHKLSGHFVDFTTVSIVQMTVLDNNPVSDKPTERIWNKDCVLTTSIPCSLHGGSKEKHGNLSRENKSLAWSLTDNVANLKYSANHSRQLMNIIL
jgi:hypothetical protein